MELTKQTDLIEKISAQYKPYIEALRTPTIKDTNRVDCLKHIYASLQLSMSYQSQEDNGAAKFISEQFYDQALIKYPFARLGEITNAFKKGALKEYGDYFGINVQTVWNWFKKYQESSELLAAKREWVNLVENDKTHFSDKPLANFEITKEQILSVYSDYLSSGDIPVYAKVYYDAILKIKGVKTLIDDQTIRLKIRNDARDWYENDLKSKKYHIKEPNNFKHLIDTFCGQNRTYESVSKRFALKEYFNYCKINNKEVV